MKELEKKSKKKEKRNISREVFKCVMFALLFSLAISTQIRLKALEARLNIFYLEDTGRMIDDYPEVCSESFFAATYSSMKYARKRPITLISEHSQVSFVFQVNANITPVSQANLILPNGEKNEMTVEEGKMQMVVHLTDPGIYTVELFENQKSPTYVAFEWKE